MVSTLSTLSTLSDELSPLPSGVRQGLTAVSFFAVISFLCSTGLFSFLSYRLWVWRHRSTVQETNQFLILIYNLLFADIQQSLAFLLNIAALRNNAIHINTSTCFAQGWFISTGDLASSVFITAIAVHTFLSICWNYKVPVTYFWGAIGLLWGFVYIVTLIGIGTHAGEHYYVRAGPWCWINAEYSTSRLWSHYIWIFTSMVSTVIIYTCMIWYLFRNGRPTQSPTSSTIYPTTKTSPGRASLSTYLILLIYPTIYVICTIPLAIGRIISMSGHVPSLEYFCVAGALISCNGLFDVLLYSLTRRSIIFADANGPSANTGITTFTFLEGMGFGNETVVETRGRSSSTEELYAGDNNGIEVKETTSVKVEEMGYGMELRNVGNRNDGNRSDRAESIMSRGSEDAITK